MSVAIRDIFATNAPFYGANGPLALKSICSSRTSMGLTFQMIAPPIADRPHIHLQGVHLETTGFQMIHNLKPIKRVTVESRELKFAKFGG